MARMPGAVWRPLAPNFDRQPRLAVVNIVCLHTMVGGLDGTDSYFRAGNGAGYDGTESHLGIGGDGRTVQWQDTAYQADANLEGNGEVLSIETADHGPEFAKWTGSDVPAWTPAQVEAIAQALAWAALEHNVPLELVPDTRPGRRGVAYHRQGCDPWRVAGGRRWSHARGKVCPGDRRIAQVPAVLARARAIVAEVVALVNAGVLLPPRPATAPAPAAPPAPAPAPPAAAPFDVRAWRVSYGQQHDRLPALRRWANRVFPAYSSTPMDEGPTTNYGPQTVAFLREFGARIGVENDGRDLGPRLADGLYRHGFRG